MTIERAMRQVIAEMTLLSYGSTTSWSSSGGGDGPERPSGDSHPLAEHWAAEWDRDPSQDTVDRARAELADVKRRSAPADGGDSTLEDWVVEDGEGYAVEQVARKFGLAENRVRRIRIKADRESEFGLPTRFAQHRDTSRERVIWLGSKGCTLRQIEMQTGVSKSKAQRWLKDAA